MVWWWLIYVCLPFYHCAYYKQYDEIDLKRYLDKAIEDQNKVLDKTEHSRSQPAYMVLGITPTCWVYFGWLHQIHAKPEPFIVQATEKRCHDYIPFIIRAQNTNNMLLIGVRRSGRRIMVQSIAGVTEVSKRLQQSDTFILAFNPRARHRQFFSQEFEQGFHYRGAFGIKNRIIIYGFNHHSVVLMELKLMQGDEDLDVGGREDRQLVPYLGPPIVVSQMVAVPSNIFIQEAFTDSERPSLLIGTHHYTYMSEGELLDVVSVPLASLMQGRHQGVEYRRYDGFLYFSNNGEFSVYPYESVRRHLGIFRVVTQIVDRERWNTSSLPPVNAILKGYTTRTWMNSYRFHRRMSYPHSIHRSVRHHIYAGWKRFVPALLGNLFIFLVLLQVVYQIIQVHEKLKYSLGMLSGSQSANSF